MPSLSAKSCHSVVIVVFPDVKLLDVAGPMQVFSDARVNNAEAYDITLVSAAGGDQQTDTSVVLSTEPLKAWRGRQIQTLLMAGGLGAFSAAKDTAFLDGVKELASQSDRVGSVCTGALVLAAAGLLDGCRAVTHWSVCDDFAARYPNVTVEPDRIFIKDKIWTSAGVTAGIDMALAIVAEDYGRKMALRVARSMVTYMARPGGQSQFSAALNIQIGDTEGRFDPLHSWIVENLEADLRVERLAEQCGMSERNFARVYQTTTGRSPAKAVELFRTAAARDMLEETTTPIGVIARKTGFVDDERLRRAMQRVLGLSPKEYRERFGNKHRES